MYSLAGVGLRWNYDTLQVVEVLNESEMRTWAFQKKKKMRTWGLDFLQDF